MEFINRKVFVFAWLQLLIFGYANAQLEHISIQNISQKDGLSNNYINCLVQDTSGFIWIGTNDGLNRYDGYTMKTYYNSPSDTLSLSDNKITALCVDAHGSLWIGTESNSICRYNPLQDNFIRYASQTYGEKKISNHFITDIKTDKNGSLLVLTQGGLNIYNHKGDYFEQIHFGLHYKITDEGIASLIKENPQNNFMNAANTIKNTDFTTLDNFIYGIQDAANKKLTDQELLLFKRHALKWIPDSEMNYNQFITMAAEDTDNIWLVYQDGGFALYNLYTKKISRFNIPPNPSNNESPIPIRSIVVDGDNLWLGTFNNGIYRYSISTNSFKKIVSYNKQGALALCKYDGHIAFFSEHNLNIIPLNPDTPEPKLISKTIAGLNFNVSDIMQDRAQNYWIASEGSGLFLMYRIKKFNLWDDTQNSSIVLSKREVTSLYADGNDNLFVGYYRNNIDRIQPETQTLKTYRNENDFNGSSAPGSVFALTGDSNNNLWLGSYYGGLQKMDMQTTVTTFLNPSNIKDLRKIVIDGNGNIWAVAHGYGMVKYDKDGNFLKHWAANYLEWENHIPDNWINDFCIDHDNNFWIATSQGLCVTDNEALKFKSYRKTNADSNSISHNSINTVYCDSRNNIWIGTWNGLNLLNRNSETFTHYSILDGLANNSINAIIEDHKGDIWLSTNAGISRLVLDDTQEAQIKHIENFDSFDSVPGEFYLRAVAKLKNGTLYFGSKNGITWFHPDSIKENKPISNVVFTDLKIFNRSIFDNNSPMSHLRSNFVQKRLVVLDYRQNVIGIDFSSLSFINNSKSKYLCKLIGFDTQWQEIGNVHAVTYTNLEPGSYYFRVKAINNNESAESIEAQLQLVILPPFWRSTWGFIFIGLMVLSGLLLLFLTLRSRIILIGRIKMRRLEADNLRELDKSKSSFYTHITHEFRTPITLIMGPIKKIINTDSSQLNVTEIKDHLKLVNRNAELLMRLVDQILDFKKADAGKISFRPVYDNIIPFILNIGETFKSLAIDKNIAFHASADNDEVYMEFDPDKLEKIVYNLLSNAFKYTLETGCVNLNIRLIGAFEKKLELEISDTGIGIAEENQANIFSLYYQADNAQTSGINGTGVGLFMVKSYTELHSGNITFTSRLNQGSSFLVQIPVKGSNNNITSSIATKINTGALNQFLIKIGSKKAVILIVEDNMDIMFFLKNELGTFFNIHSAHNGIEALKLMQTIQPDLILSDVMMPKMDGYELCKKIKNNISTSHIPVILLTAKISHESKLEGYSAGADDYLTKPFDTEILIAKIERIIESRKQIRVKIMNNPNTIPNEIVNNHPTESAFLENLFKILEKNLDNATLDVEFLAKELGISRTVLYEKLNILTGQPVADFIKSYRLNRAMQLIEARGSNISEIVWKVGFKSHAHFTRAFKLRFNCTPSEYHKRIESAK